MVTEVAVYALLATDSHSTEAALAFLFEADEVTQSMQHTFIRATQFNEQ